MSVHENDEDVDVVSSPEPSPHHSNESEDRRTSTPICNRSPAIDQTNDRASVSPAKTEDPGKTNANFTSFSISTILSKNEGRKDHAINASFLPTTNFNETGSLEDAAMISR